MGARPRATAALLAATALATSGCWPQPGAGAGNTNHNAVESELGVDAVTTLTEAWSAPGEPAAVIGGKVIVDESTRQSGLASVAARSTVTGESLWRRTFVVGVPVALLSPPVVVGDEVWTGWAAQAPVRPLCEAAIERLDLATGGTVARTPGRMPATAIPFGDGVVLRTWAMSSDCEYTPSRELRVVDPDTGATRWSAPDVPGRPVVGEGQVHVADGGILRSYPTDCGQSPCPATWEVDLGAQIAYRGVDPALPLVATLHGDAATGRAAELVTVDRATGTVLGRTSLPWDGFAGRAAVADGIGYVTEGDRLLAYDVAACTTDGCTPVWTATLAGQESGNLAVADDVLHVPTDSGAVQAFDAAGCGAITCDELSHVTVDGVPTTTIAADGHLLVGTDEHVTAFTPAG